MQVSPRPSRLSRPERPGSSGAPSSGEPRAKPLTARDLRGPSRATLRALDRFAEASSAFDAACDDRSGLGLIDERYADLGARAAAVVRCLLDERDARARGWADGWADERVTRALARHARDGRAPGDEPEADLELARLALRASGRGRRPSS